ncbi:MAG: YcjF family protein [Nannocystis sp.]|nr:YcjF family protein [Nannocystis sp.]
MATPPPPAADTNPTPPRSDAADAGADPVAEASRRSDEAREVIKRNVYWAIGLGAIPLPLVDAAGVLVAQIKMIRELAEIYDIPFSESRAKAIVSALATSLGTQTLSYAFIGSIFKIVPALGPAFGLVTMPIVAGALTRTLGNVFMMHFDSGGVLLDFDVAATRGHFKREFERNKVVVEGIRRDRQP